MQATVSYWQREVWGLEPNVFIMAEIKTKKKLVVKRGSKTVIPRFL